MAVVGLNHARCDVEQYDRNKHSDRSYNARSRTLKQVLFAFGLLLAANLSCDIARESIDIESEDSNQRIAVDPEEAAVQLATPASPHGNSDENGGIVVVEPSEQNGVMVVANLCLPFDPAIESAATGRRIYRLPLVREIHAGLMRVSPDSPSGVEVDLAESFTLHEDASKYRFKLRKDLKFSDGSPLTAEDVKWSWERSLRLSTPWSRSRVVLGNIVGSTEVIADAERIRQDETWLRLQDPLDTTRVFPQAHLAGVEVIDNTTLDVSLIHSDPEFPVLLSEPSSFVLKESNVVSWTVSWTNDVFPGIVRTDVTKANSGKTLDPAVLPVGAGPFQLIAYAHNVDYDDTCAIARNENYWDGAPQLGGVVFVPPGLPFGQAMESAYVSGMIDYVLPPIEFVGKGLTSESVISETQRPPLSRFLALNPKFPPFDDVNARRALLASNDLAEVYAHTKVEWPDTVVPPRLNKAYQHCDRNAYSTSPPEQTMRTAPYHERFADFEVEFWSRGENYQTDRVKILLDQWERSLGLRYRILDIFIGDKAETVMRDDDLQLRLVEIAPETPSLVALFLDLIAIFGDEEPHQEWKVVEQKVFAAIQETDKASQLRQFREIECHLYERALVLPMIVDWVDFEINIQPWVNDFKLPTFGRSVFKDVWFDDTAPERELPWH